MVSNTVDNSHDFQMQIAQKNLQVESQSLSCQFRSYIALSIAFHLRPIWLQTLVAIDSESWKSLFASFCAQPSEVAVLFH